MHAVALLARTAAGLQAFVGGRRLGQEWAHGDLLEREVRAVIAREPPRALAIEAVKVGTTTYAFLKKKELLALGVLGVLVGSGAVGRALQAINLRGGREVERIQSADEPTDRARG